MSYFTSFSPSDRLSDFSALEFWLGKHLEKIHTIKLCKITARNADGTYDAETMVNALSPYTNQGTPIRLRSLPAIRIQGGASAFLIDYSAGDIVLVGVTDTDSQTAVRSKDFAAPGTSIRFPLSSGFILGAVLSSAPEVYIKAADKLYVKGDIDSDDGVRAGTVTAGEITASDALNISGTVSVSGTPGINGAFTDAGGNTHTVKNGIIIS